MTHHAHKISGLSSVHEYKESCRPEPVCRTRRPTDGVQLAYYLIIEPRGVTTVFSSERSGSWFNLIVSNPDQTTICTPLLRHQVQQLVSNEERSNDGRDRPFNKEDTLVILRNGHYHGVSLPGLRSLGGRRKRYPCICLRS